MFSAILPNICTFYHLTRLQVISLVMSMLLNNFVSNLLCVIAVRIHRKNRV